MQDFFEALAAIVGQENLFTDKASRLACARGAAFPPEVSPRLPLACVRPRTSSQVGKILHLCAQKNQQVAFCGGATAWSGSDGLVILTQGLNRIYDVNATDQTMCLQPGVICQAAREAAARARLFLPSLPLSAQVATIGGALANNAAGPDTSKYGFLAARVLSLDVWLGSGEKLTCFGANDLPGQLSPSLPLAQLLAGSRGTLGFLGDMRLRLSPQPDVRVSLLYAGPWEQIIDAASHLARLQPAELYLLNDLAATAVGATQPLLYVELHEAATVEDARHMAAGLAPQAHVDGFLGRRPGILPALYGKYGSFEREYCAFPPHLLAKFALGAAEIAARHQVRLAIGGSAAVARMHTLVFPQGGGPGQVLAAKQELFALELMLNDALQSEEDASLSRQQWQERQGTDFSRQLRRLCDPAGILNPA